MHFLRTVVQFHSRKRGRKGGNNWNCLKFQSVFHFFFLFVVSTVLFTSNPLVMVPSVSPKEMIMVRFAECVRVEKTWEEVCDGKKHTRKPHGEKRWRDAGKNIKAILLCFCVWCDCSVVWVSLL